MKILKRIIVVMLFSIIAMLYACTNNINDVKNVENVENAKKVETETLSITKADIDISDVEGAYKYQEIKYPELKANIDDVQQLLNTINAELKNTAENFKKENAEAIREMIKEDETNRENMMYAFDSTFFETKTNNDKYLSLVNFAYENLMGAHPMHSMGTYNFDLVAKKQINLSDLIKDKTKLKEFLYDWCDKNKDEYGLFDTYKDSIDFYINNIKDFQFYIKDDEVHVVFQVYDIAPYASSEIEIKIPKELYQ